MRAKRGKALAAKGFGEIPFGFNWPQLAWAGLSGRWLASVVAGWSGLGRNGLAGIEVAEVFGEFVYD